MHYGTSSRTIKNILHNLNLHEITTCDDRDPPWNNRSMRRLIQDKNEACKRFKRCNNNSQHFQNFQSLQGFPLKRLDRDITLVY